MNPDAPFGLKRIYLDVCALCRPFDDQHQVRIRLETRKQTYGVAAPRLIVRKRIYDEYDPISKRRRTDLSGPYKP